MRAAKALARLRLCAVSSEPSLLADMKNTNRQYRYLLYISGKATGIVTTARLTHATPAAAYAHSPNRRWESDYDTVTRNVTGGCKDIALQLIEENPHINVSHIYTTAKEFKIKLD